MALDTIGREVGEHDRVPDRIDSTRYVWRDDSDFMSSTEDLHQLLVEQKQHMQGRVTWSETKLMIGNQAIGEEEGFNVGSDDELADDWEKADWSVIAGLCFCIFFFFLFFTQSGNVC